MRAIAIPAAVAVSLISTHAFASRSPEQVNRGLDAAAVAPYPLEQKTKTRRSRLVSRKPAHPRRARQARHSPQPRSGHSPASLKLASIGPAPKLERPILNGALDEYVPGADAPDWLDRARDYLVATIIEPGGTMERQGIRTSIERLHPQFAVRLAAAIREARANGIRAFVFSAYRPPNYGVGGYSNKFNSAHTYGLAVDMGGIGRPCSGAAREWKRIANENGLYLPYGACNGAEFNHTQLMETYGRQFVEQHPAMRRAVNGNGPINKLAMWVASGLKLVIASITPVAEAEPIQHYAIHRRVHIAARHKRYVHYAHHRRIHYARHRHTHYAKA